MSNFPDYAGPLTETILLGNLAVWAAAKARPGDKVEWDAEKMTAKGAADLDKIIKTGVPQGLHALAARERVRTSRRDS